MPELIPAEPGTPCAAALPSAATTAQSGLIWTTCGMPAIAIHVYACIHEHVVRKATCAKHAPEPGAVGCRQCFDLGHECELRYQDA